MQESGGSKLATPSLPKTFCLRVKYLVNDKEHLGLLCFCDGSIVIIKNICLMHPLILNPYKFFLQTTFVSLDIFWAIFRTVWNDYAHTKEKEGTFFLKSFFKRTLIML